MDVDRLIEICKDNGLVLILLLVTGIISVYLMIIIKRIFVKLILFALVFLLPLLFIAKLYFYPDESLEEIKEKVIQKYQDLRDKSSQMTDKIKGSISDLQDNIEKIEKPSDEEKLPKK